MKMKEVLERTGLTDRAVRLYISNELVNPECSRGYTGRNNYDFSEADVEVLQKIALLRKADFSIEQIRALQQGGEEARAAMNEYLEEKREEYRRDGLILEALEGLSGEEAPDLDELCRRLTAGFRAKQVPREDLKPTWKERLESIFFMVVSGLIILFYGFLNITIILYLCYEFVFPKCYDFKLSYPTWIGHLILLTPIALCLWVFIKHSTIKWVCETQEIRKTSVNFLVISLAITILAMPFSMFLVGITPVVYSETDDPDNYLILSNMMHVSAEELYQIFPVSIPYAAYEEIPGQYSENTKYYFRYRGNVDQDWDIYAEWELPDAGFQQEILRIRQNLQENQLYEHKLGDWVCLSLEAGDLKDYTDNYCHFFFAYHLETNTVRYIYSYCHDSGGDTVPYFLTLDWES